MLSQGTKHILRGGDTVNGSRMRRVRFCRTQPSALGVFLVKFVSGSCTDLCGCLASSTSRAHLCVGQVLTGELLFWSAALRFNYFLQLIFVDSHLV